MAIGAIIGAASFAASMAQQKAASDARRAQFGAQAATQRLSAEATLAEAEEVRMSTQFDVERLRKAGVRELADIEAAFAEAGQGLDEMTTEALIEAQTEIELAALMELRKGRFEESQQRVEASALAQQEAQSKKASEKKFLGLF